MMDPLAGASTTPLWLDDPARPARRDPLVGSAAADLVVVGGGYSGLWSALLAKEADPSRDVVLLEAESIGWAASGRNGGFCEASLTHGAANGRERFPDEYPTLERLGRENLRDLRATLDRYAIDCELEPSGELTVATEPYQVAELRAESALGGGVFLDRDEVRREVDSPTYLAGLWDKESTVMVNPAKLAWGLADACESLGVRIYEGSLVRSLRRGARGLTVTTRQGAVEADRAVLATNVFPSLLRRVRPRVIPVYDYAIATEPLTSQQLDSVGWHHRQGIGDSGNQFHYYRLTADNRVVFGGYDAVYYFGKAIKPRLDQRDATFGLLAAHLVATFPQLTGVRFTHKWGGAVDLCGRFCAFFGTAHRGRVAYAAGYTGLGVGATRFGAQVMLDLLSGEETERTRTRLVCTKPPPFPPEPFAYAGVQITRAALAAADRNEGRRNLWLRTLDRVGLGYDS
jgi:glycine/D-amino acid oxidase-like deaminating enzyme